MVFKNIKKRIFENDKKDFNFSRNHYLETDINIENSKLNNDKGNIKKKKQSIKSTVENNVNDKNIINKDVNIYKTYRPVISKKYENRFKNF